MLREKTVRKSFMCGGDFPVLFTSNTSLALKLNGDVEAWRRRILIINFKSGGKKNTKFCKVTF